jgi:hypothetical protein
MPITFACASCGHTGKVPDTFEGLKVKCPGCGTPLAVGTAPPADGTGTPPPSYHRARRELALIQLRQRARWLCDRIGLGPSTGERFCCGLIVAVVPFGVSFLVAIAFHEQALHAVLQGVGSFALVATFCALLVTVGQDEALEGRRAYLVRELPAAEAALRERRRQARMEKERRRAERDEATMRAFLDRQRAEAEKALAEAERRRHRPTTRRCPYCDELIRAEAVKCKHCGEMLDDSFRPDGVHGPKRSGGTAAVLEILFGLLFQTFGPGHFYAGNVGTGLFFMLGYWAFLIANVVLASITCGLWLPVAMVAVPTVWFVLMIVSPLLAANDAAGQ